MREQVATTRHTSISGEVVKGVDSDVEGKRQTDIESNTGSRYRCRLDLQLVACTVCNLKQPAIRFKGSYQTLLGQYHRRCND